MTLTGLPQPTDEQAQVHRALMARIVAEMDARGGAMDFCDYMQRCLYEPGLGYYANPFTKLGRAGDFTTAAEISTDFADCLAAQIAQLPAQLCGASILEFGGGSGQLACDILLALQRLGVQPARYYLLDVSASLSALQRATVADKLPAQLAERVEWLQRLPSSMTGVVLANELFDAFAVERFQLQNGRAAREYVLRADDGQLTRQFRPDEQIAARVGQIQDYTGEVLADGYESEYCPLLGPWWRSLGQMLSAGVVLACDYGQERADYYSAGRSSGSLRCFFRHQVHDNPLVYAGIQDITADVDFTAVTEAATDAGFELQGYTPLAQFMLSLDALQRFEAGRAQLDTRRQLEASGRLKRLLLPQEMGDRFKVIGFSKRVDSALRGFSLADQTRLL